MIVIDFFKSSLFFLAYFPAYIARRFQQLVVFLTTIVVVVFEGFNISKDTIVSRMFWGRGSSYRNVFHFAMLVTTILFVFTGLVRRINAVNTSVLLSGNTTGLEDLLQQGGTIQTVLARNPEVPGISTKKHTVANGETLESIAEKYGITMDTIRWASPGVLSPFTNEIEPGWVLTIPEINGVYYTVKYGDTLDGIIALMSVTNNEANRFSILEFNQLSEPVTLEPGQKIFIPDGNLRDYDSGPTQGIPRGVFINPAGHPDCGGYTISRGFLSYHNGVDIAHWPECPIIAVANGYVTYAGWSNYGEGYNVHIYHGGGIETHYYHGNGTFWVKTGDRVQQGDPIMMMGSTGNSTGVHLHFSLFKDGYAVNPYGFVPY